MGLDRHKMMMCLHLVSLFTDPLFSIQSPSSARDKKINHGGFIDRRHKGVGVGEALARSRACQCFPKEQKEK